MAIPAHSHGLPHNTSLTLQVLDAVGNGIQAVSIGAKVPRLGPMLSSGSAMAGYGLAVVFAGFVVGNLVAYNAANTRMIALAKQLVEIEQLWMPIKEAQKTAEMLAKILSQS